MIHNSKEAVQGRGGSSFSSREAPPLRTRRLPARVRSQGGPAWAEILEEPPTYGGRRYVSSTVTEHHDGNRCLTPTTVGDCDRGQKRRETSKSDDALESRWDWQGQANPSRRLSACARFFPKLSGHAGPPWDLPRAVNRRVRAGLDVGQEGTIRLSP
jgi:hypothetical protein